MQKPPPESDLPQDDAPPKIWTAPEVRALRQTSGPPLSLWQVVRWQLVAAVALGGFAWGANQLGWRVHQPSVWWGALSALLPQAAAAWGLRERGPNPPAAALLRLGVWELVKVLLSVALLVSAGWVVAPVQWLGLVLAFVLVTKVVLVVGLTQLRKGRSGEPAAVGKHG